MARAEVVKVLNEELKDASFSRTKAGWFRDTRYGRAIIGLERSSFGATYVEMTAFYPAVSYWLDGFVRPGTSHHDSPIRTQLQGGPLGAWSGSSLQELDKLRVAVRNVALPWLDEMCDPLRLLQLPPWSSNYRPILLAIIESDPDDSPESVCARANPSRWEPRAET
jgi:hypothetical protein